MTLLILKSKSPTAESLFATIALTATLLASPLASAQSSQLVPGNLVVAVEGCGVNAGTCTAVPNGTGTGTANSSAGGYGDNQAAPLTLFQFAPSGTSAATFVNSIALPQIASGTNFPVSGEYGSSSEATLQLSGSGQYLAIMGYGVNAAAFDADPALYGAAPSLALGQSGSLTGQSYTPVPRVVALIDSNGTVNSSTPIYNIFNTNNPRSVYTANGTTAYVSGQGSGSDATAGVFYTALGAPNKTPTAITGLDTTNNTFSQDTRDVQVVNNTLYVSVDTKGGSNSARSYIGTLGTAGLPPTSLFGPPVMLNNFGTTAQNGKVTITSGPNSNGNGPNAGLQINVSPNGFFFASPSILYVADTGNGKQTSANSSLGDGGLQKWINTAADGSGTWNLAYTLYLGLNLVSNKSASGTTGLYALAGAVSGSSVLLYATDATIGDMDTTHLVGITDTLAFTTASQAAAESFTVLASAPMDSNFKGVSFAPTVATTIPPATPANLVVTRALSRTGGNVLVQITISNTGGTQAPNVILTGVKIGSVTATPLPLTLGAIDADASAQATFTIPGTVGASGAASSITISGTSSGASFSSSARITLP